MLAWWHPSKGGLPGLGARGRASDVHLWLPYVVARYVRATGDRALLDEPAPFLEGAAVAARRWTGWCSRRASRATPPRSTSTAGARSRGPSRSGGRHGLPLLGSGDWNDALDRVGRAGRGESVWLGFFLHDVLVAFADLGGRKARRSRDADRARGRAAARGARVDVARRALRARHHRRGRGARLRGCPDRRLAGALGRGRLRAGTPRRRERARAPRARRPGAAAGAALRRALASVPGPDRGLSAGRARERRAVLARRLLADRCAGPPLGAGRGGRDSARRRRGCGRAPSRSGSRSLRSPR